MKRPAQILGIVVLALATLGADVDRQRFEKLGHEMMCTCGCNQILLECNHVGCPSSEKMRQELSAHMQDGKDEKLVLAAFVDKYGPTVLAAPTTTGFNRVAWITPFAVFVLGLGLAIVVVRNWKFRPAEPAAAGAAPKLDDYRERARQETEI
jgi:cytochrome c-type biogenesis protein CcmH/NrfF